MDLQTAMARLEANGSERTAAIYRRHSGIEDMAAFGVSFAFLKELKKEIKKDHALALALWATGNLDARLLATFIADPKATTAEQVDACLQDVRMHLLTDSLTSNWWHKVAAANAQRDAWRHSADEWSGRTGWQLVTLAALHDKTASDAYFLQALHELEAELQQSANRKKEAMNYALIGIGTRNDTLEAAAIAAAERIGRVDIDHGDTACKTPDAIPYIQRTKERKLAKSAK